MMGEALLTSYLFSGKKTAREVSGRGVAFLEEEGLPVSVAKRLV